MNQVLEFKVQHAPTLYMVGRSLVVDNTCHSQDLIEDFWEECTSLGLFKLLEGDSEILYTTERIGYSGNWVMGCDRFTYVAGMLFRQKAEFPGLDCIRLDGGLIASALFLKRNDARFFNDIHDSAVTRILQSGFSNTLALYSLEIYQDAGESAFSYLTYSLPVRRAQALV